jgi:rsbT co-antagonist protein RsbR
VGSIPKEQFFETILYREIIENIFEATIIHSDYKVIYINEPGARMLGAKKEELIGVNVLDIFPNDAKDEINERVRKALEENEIGALIEQTIILFDGSTLEVELYCHPFMYGEKRAVISVLRDITSRKEIELELKKKVSEISTPIVPLLDGISIIPLVGTMDFDQTKTLLDILPEKLKLEDDIKHIIIDFSGIYNIDEVVIDFLMKINSIMKLLGINPIITGIRPELAQSALQIGNDLYSITTISTVKQALRYLKQLP